MKIAVIGAMPKEISLLVEYYKAVKMNGNFDLYKAKNQGCEIIISGCGCGKVNAAMNTQYLIDMEKPDIIINTGCAGSLIQQVKVMDTVVSDTITYHDFLPIRVMQGNSPDQGKMKCDEKLTNITIEIIKSLNLPYHIGGVCSGDCFVTNANQRDQIQMETKAICVDMESGSIAHVCRKNNIPFIVIRSISDFSDGVEEKEKEAAERSNQIVIKLIEQLEKEKV